MIIKGNLEGTHKLRVWDENIHTTIQDDNEKGPTEQNWGSTEQTVITYMRKKTEK